jgi:UrcA family protein
MKTQTLRIRLLGTVVALAGTLGLGLSAQAADTAPSAFPAVTVKYGDLNIDSKSGARMLYTPLGHAAEQACGGRPSLMVDMPRYRRFMACYDDALDRAVQKVDKPQLQALHAARRVESRVT